MSFLDEIVSSYQNKGIVLIDTHELKKDDIALTLAVHVHPGAKQEKLEVREGILNIFIQARAQDGKANERLKKVLAKKLGISPSSVLIDKGQRSRDKKIIINYVSTPHKQGDYFREKINLL